MFTVVADGGEYGGAPWNVPERSLTSARVRTRDSTHP